MLAGVLESPDLRNEELSVSMDDSYLAVKLNKTAPPVDPLAAELGVHVLDCRKPYLPFSEFYNEPLSDGVEMDRDFANYKSELGTTRDRLLTPPSDRCPFQENFVSCIIRSF
jgi:ubiquitin-protein ligase E3 A